MLSWRALAVYDHEGVCWGELEELVNLAPANLDSAVIVDGKISEWPGFFIAAPNEEPSSDTPRVDVNWDGFEHKLSLVRGK